MQGAYAFFVNPLGIQGDGKMDVTGNFGPKEDMIWESKGRITKNGYIVEIRIPLKSIRFSKKKTNIFRLGFFRQLPRYSQMVTSPPIDPKKGGILKQTRPVSFTGLKYKRVIEILPSFTYSNVRELDQGQLKLTRNQAEIGLTSKIGLSSDLVLDATINPDFSQVEADAGRVDVNLRYALYYPEKRPFFLEGSDLFKIAGNTEEAPLQAIVHTRRIIDPYFGLKLTGKIGKKSSIELLHAKDRVHDGDKIFKPDYTIFRLVHSLKEDSYLGGFLTRKWTSGGEHNEIIGTDGRIRLGNLSTIGYHLVGSFFKNPDDPAKYSTHALGASYNFGNNNLIIDAGLQDISKDFKVDTGYLTRNNITRFTLLAMYRFYPKSSFIKRIEPFYWSSHIYNKDCKKFESFNLFSLRFQLLKSTQVRFDGILANEVFNQERFNRNAFRLQSSSKPNKKITLGLFLNFGNRIYYDDNPYQGYGFTGNLVLAYQPWEKLHTQFAFTSSDFFRETTGEKIYSYKIYRNRSTFQLNKYFYIRAITEYNTYRKSLSTDILASFTYIPGTVVYAGYGSGFQKIKYQDREYINADTFLEIRRGFFFKVSYLIRL
jgi:hypothetical protein